MPADGLVNGLGSDVSKVSLLCATDFINKDVYVQRMLRYRQKVEEYLSSQMITDTEKIMIMNKAKKGCGKHC